MKSHKVFLFSIFCVKLILNPSIAVRILREMNPMDIPSQRPLSYRLSVNAEIAKQSGIPINRHFLGLDYRVIGWGMKW